MLCGLEVFIILALNCIFSTPKNIFLLKKSNILVADFNLKTQDLKYNSRRIRKQNACYIALLSLILAGNSPSRTTLIEATL